MAIGLFGSVGVLQARVFADKAAAKAYARELKGYAAAFNKADTNNDDQLSLDEFESLMKPLVKERRGKGKHGQNPQLTADLEFTASLLFEWFDEDGDDSSISMSEWMSGHFADTWHAVLDLDLIPLGAVDRNGNGKATAGEFKALVSGYVPGWLADSWCYYFLHPEAEQYHPPGFSGASLSIAGW